MERIAKMAKPAAALLSNEPDVNGGTAARAATLPESGTPLHFRPLARASVLPRTSFVILLIQSILSRPFRTGRAGGIPSRGWA